MISDYQALFKSFAVQPCKIVKWNLKSHSKRPSTTNHQSSIIMIYHDVSCSFSRQIGHLHPVPRKWRGQLEHWFLEQWPWVLAVRNFNPTSVWVKSGSRIGLVLLFGYRVYFLFNLFSGPLPGSLRLPDPMLQRHRLPTKWAHSGQSLMRLRRGPMKGETCRNVLLVAGTFCIQPGRPVLRKQSPFTVHIFVSFFLLACFFFRFLRFCCFFSPGSAPWSPRWKCSRRFLRKARPKRKLQKRRRRKRPNLDLERHRNRHEDRHESDHKDLIVEFTPFPKSLHF